ncbi:MAG: hypothetical protein WA194_07280 [Patescibacteria group bacterium]
MDLCKFHYPEREDIREPTDADIEKMNRKQRREYFRPVKSCNKKAFPHASIRSYIGYACTDRKGIRKPVGGLSREAREYLILAFYLTAAAILVYFATR